MSPQRQFGALLVGASLTLMALTSAPTAWADDPADPLNALMMGGSFMPTPSEFWQDNIITDYIDPATGDIYTPVLVPTPESAASSSVPVGLANLQAAMAHEQPAGQPYLIEGYSQSASDRDRRKTRPHRIGQPPPDVTFLLLGSGNRPDGGFLERFAGLVIPGAPGFDFNGAEPTDAGITTIDIANQYDGNADFPQYPINVVADINSLLGFHLRARRVRGRPTARTDSGHLAAVRSAVWTVCRRIRARVHRDRQTGRRRHDVLFHPHHRSAATRPAAQPGRTRTGAQHLPAGTAGDRRGRLRPLHPVRRPHPGRADPHHRPGDVHARVRQRRGPRRQ